MSKIANYPSKLAAFMKERSEAKYEWGTHDCCMWAGDWVLRCSGFDPCEVFRGQYDTFEGAIKALKKHLGDAGRGLAPQELFHAVTIKLAREHKLKPVHSRWLETGDLAVVRLPKNPVGGALGVCHYRSVYTPAHQGGLAAYDMPQVVRAWRI
jgi:hypothetical protein